MDVYNIPCFNTVIYLIKIKQLKYVEQIEVINNKKKLNDCTFFCLIVLKQSINEIIHIYL